MNLEAAACELIAGYLTLSAGGFDVTERIDVTRDRPSTVTIKGTVLAPDTEKQELFTVECSFSGKDLDLVIEEIKVDGTSITSPPLAKERLSLLLKDILKRPSRLPADSP